MCVEPLHARTRAGHEHRVGQVRGRGGGDGHEHRDRQDSRPDGGHQGREDAAPAETRGLRTAALQGLHCLCLCLCMPLASPRLLSCLLLCAPLLVYEYISRTQENTRIFLRPPLYTSACVHCKSAQPTVRLEVVFAELEGRLFRLEVEAK